MPDVSAAELVWVTVEVELPDDNLPDDALELRRAVLSTNAELALVGFGCDMATAQYGEPGRKKSGAWAMKACAQKAED